MPARRGRGRKVVESRKHLMFDDQNATDGKFSDEENQREVNEEESQGQSNDSISMDKTDGNNSRGKSVARTATNSKGETSSAAKKCRTYSRKSRLLAESRPNTPRSERQQILLAIERSTIEINENNSSETLGDKNNSGKSPNDAKALSLNKRGETELHSAAVRGDLQGLSFWIKTTTPRPELRAPPPEVKPADVLIPVDVNTQDCSGWTALHEAFNTSNLHIARNLLEEGADPNQISKTGATPIIDAVINNDFSAVQLLLNHGANPLIPTSRGLNAFDYVREHKVEKLLTTYFLLNKLEIPKDLKFKFCSKSKDLAAKNSAKAKKIESEVEDIKKKEVAEVVVGEQSKTSPPQVGTSSVSEAATSKKTETPEGNVNEVVPKPKEVVQTAAADSKTPASDSATKAEAKSTKLGTIAEGKEIRIVPKETKPAPATGTTKPKIVRIKDILPEGGKSDDLKLKLKIPRSSSSDTLQPKASSSAGQYSLLASDGGDKVTINKITTVLKVKKVKPIGEQVRSQSTSSVVEVVVDNPTSGAKPCLKSKFKLNSLSNTYQLANDSPSQLSPKDSSGDSSASKMSATQSSAVITSQTTPTTNVATSASTSSVVTSSVSSEGNIKVEAVDTSVTVTNATTVTTTATAPVTVSGPVSEKLSLVGSNNKSDNDNGNNNAEGVNIKKEPAGEDNGHKNNNKEAPSSLSSAMAAAAVGHSLRGRKRRKSAEQVGSSSSVSPLVIRKAKEAEGKLTTITSTGATLKLKKPSSEGGGDYEEEDAEEIEIEKVVKTEVTNEQGGGGQQQPLKVPPLRIVLPPSTSTTTLTATTNPNIVVLNPSTSVSSALNTLNLGTTSGVTSESSLAATAAASTSAGNFSGLVTGKYPYVMAGGNNDDTDGEPSSPSSSAATSATTSNTTTTTRITRSSQRVANQKAHHHAGSDDDATPSHSTRKKKFRGINQQQHQSYSRSNSPLTLSVQQQHQDQDDNSSSSTASGPIVSGSNNGGGGGNGAVQGSMANCSTSNGNGAGGSGEGGAVAASANNGGSSIDPQSSSQQYDPDRNSYRMFESIRSLVVARRQNMKQVSYDPPRDFSEYLTTSRNYLLHRSPKTMQPKVSQPPSSLKPRTSLYQLFVEQEQERHRLRVQHQVQLDKLRLCYEQETLRLRTRMAHAAAQQLVPLSVCTYLKDEELYNLVEFANDPTVDNVIISHIREVNSRFQNDGPSGMTNSYGGIKCSAKTKEFLIWKAEIDEKWRKRKEETLARQRMEADALASKQRLRWIWKQCQSEIGPGPASDEQAHYDALNIDEMFVPTVKVVADLDLLPNGI